MWVRFFILFILRSDRVPEQCPMLFVPRKATTTARLGSMARMAVTAARLGSMWQCQMARLWHDQPARLRLAGGRNACDPQQGLS